MGKINKILEYNFTEKQKYILIKEGISNWCWKKWWFNFSDFFDKVQKFFWFKSEKFESFKSDVKNICSFSHDPKFWEWWNIIDFLVCNYVFANDVLKLLRWTNSYARFIAFCTLFFWLSIFWISAFNWWEKRDINEFLNTKK